MGLTRQTAEMLEATFKASIGYGEISSPPLARHLLRRGQLTRKPRRAATAKDRPLPKEGLGAV